MSWFFRQWLNRSGVPRLGGEWHYDAEHKRVDVMLTQAQTGDPYRLPVDISLVFPAPGKSRAEHVEFTESRTTFTFPADSEPASVVLDPETWLLAEMSSFGKGR